jgi:hypothetical protein
MTMLRITCIALLSGLCLPSLAANPWQRHTIDQSSRGADGVRLADVNNDGLPDIATGWEEGGVIRAYLNPGPQQVENPWPAVTVGRVKSAEDAVFADLDGDGRTDVISCCEGRTRTVYVHWAPPRPEQYLDSEQWQTEPIPATRGEQLWMFALPMNVDGRHGIDLVLGSKGGGATIGWLQSPADPRDLGRWRFHPFYDAGWIMSVQAADMDNDGDSDIVASDRKGPARGLLWLQNPGPDGAASGQPWREHRIGAEDREVMFLTLGDLDADGKRDVVCAVKGRGLTVFRATGDAVRPWQKHEIAMPDNCGTGKGVAICDVDGNGRKDLIFTCEHANGDKSGARWLSYQRTVFDPIWNDHEISGPEGVKFDRIELLDLDDDGDPDLITCEERHNLGLIWYENPSQKR